MASSERKTVLAIEWVWLVIGAGVVFAHLVEAWATPYMPLLWMIGMICLFVAYRFADALRQIYWPAPEPDEEALHVARIRAYKDDDDAPSTAEVVLPHMRGRRRRAASKKQAGDRQAASGAGEQLADTDEIVVSEPPRQIAVPSATGAYHDDDLATVLADLTDREATDLVDRAEIRPETEADVTTSAITIPTFAESQLSRAEREKALDAIRGGERRRPRPKNASSQGSSSPKRPSDRGSSGRRPSPPARNNDEEGL